MHTTTAAANPVQLRLGFAAPSRPVTVHLVLAGLSVLVETSPDQVDEVWTHLSVAGANPTMSEGRGLGFPVANLSALAELPTHVHLVPDEALATLFTLVRNPSELGRPAELSTDAAGTLWLSWFDGRAMRTELLPEAGAAALLTADLPFVATAEAFETLRTTCRLPLLVGKARVNLDGYVEITTSKPQMAESAPLPGLFRIDETHYGLALPHAAHVDRAPGFIWEGRKPSLERGPAELPGLPMELSGHAAADLRNLVDHLAAYRARAVVWESGLGRRVFVLAALEALDAWPLLIVCPPAHVWTWQRHLEMFGRTAALGHDGADAHIVTYADLARRGALTSPQAIIFDELPNTDVVTAEQRTALHRLDGVVDAYRVAVGSSWPTAEQDAVSVMSVLRPGEFRPDVPVIARYPAHTQARLAEHISCYVSARSVTDPGTDVTEFRSSGVITLTPTDAQRQAQADAAARHAHGSAAALLAEHLEILSCGPQLALSPKVAAVTARAAAAVEAGRRVAVVTRHRRTEALVKATLRQFTSATVDASVPHATVPNGRLVVVRFDRELPDLRWFDEVFIMDYPWSTDVLDAAVGAASDPDGPLRVSVLHLAGTIDDRLAMLAARRRELGSVVDQSAPPSAAEMAYLLADDIC